MFIQVASALGYIHEKDIVHRDLKPENILVSRRNRLLNKTTITEKPLWRKLMRVTSPESACLLDAFDIKISDFGLAKLVADGYSIAKTQVGTQQYWAPEVALMVEAQQSGQSQRGNGGGGLNRTGTAVPKAMPMPGDPNYDPNNPEHVNGTAGSVINSQGVRAGLRGQVKGSVGGQPTQMQGNAQSSASPSGYGREADLWSLGVVLYVMICGKFPFIGSTSAENLQKGYFQFPSHNKNQLSHEVKNLIESLIERNPARRLSVKNALRCKWATKSIIHLKCAFYRLQPASSNWKYRKIVLPVPYDFPTACIASLIFGNANTNSKYLKRQQGGTAARLPQGTIGERPDSDGAGTSPRAFDILDSAHDLSKQKYDKQHLAVLEKVYDTLKDYANEYLLHDVFDFELEVYNEKW